MARIRTDSLGAAAGFQDAVEDAALPVRRPDAGLPAQPAAKINSGLGILRQTARMLRDAGIAVAMMLTVPVALVAIRGDVLFQQTNFSAYVHQNIANVGAARSFGVLKDASISPIDAGRSFAALQPVKVQLGFTPTLPAVRSGPSWRDALLTPKMFSGARPDVYRGTSAITILGVTAKGLSPAEIEYLRALATGWEWRDFDKVARAPQVDILGGQLQIPFGEGAYPEMRPVAFRDIRDLAYAGVSRAAYHLAIGQRDSAEAILRSIISVGFALVDNGSAPLDEMIGSTIVGVGRAGLRQFYEVTNDPRAASPALATPPKMETPAYRFRPPPRSTEETRARLIATVGDRRIPMGERFESLELLSGASCTNVRELMFGPREDVRRALDNARTSLGRFPSERALVDITARRPQPSSADVSSNPITMIATSAATVPGAVLRNPRLAACTRMLSSW